MAPDKLLFPSKLLKTISHQCPNNKKTDKTVYLEIHSHARQCSQPRNARRDHSCKPHACQIPVQRSGKRGVS